MKIGIELYIAMAHRLYPYEGKCNRIHGHTYKVELELEKEFYGNFVVDFGDIKSYFNDEWDHYLVLSRTDPLVYVLKDEKIKTIDFMPTCENLARYMAMELKQKFELDRVKIKLYESPTTFAEVEE